MKQINMKEFVNSYLQTAAWVTCESDECQDFTRYAKSQAMLQCLDFIYKVQNKFGIERANELLTIAGNDFAYLAPHDFWLTRNGHGAGFWDKENVYGENEAKILTDISKECGEIDCYHVRGKKSKLTF